MHGFDVKECLGMFVGIALSNDIDSSTKSEFFSVVRTIMELSE